MTPIVECWVSFQRGDQHISPPPSHPPSPNLKEISEIISGIGDGIAITGSGWAQGGNYDYITIPRCLYYYKDKTTMMMLGLGKDTKDP